MTTPVRVERVDRVTVLTLDRPDRLNSVSTPLVAALAEAVADIANDPSVGAVVVTGAGRAFSAGADIVEFSAFERPSEFAAFVGRMAAAYSSLQSLAQPSVAAINGLALGGGFELALACDLRICGARARVGVPEIQLGLLPAAGATARLTRMLPPGLAKQMLLTGAPLAADEAHRLGLVNEVVDDDRVLDHAVELATRLAALPAQALAAAKRLVDEGVDLSLEAAIAFERETVSALFATADRVEGLAAFLEKRPPTFGHR